MARSGTRDEGRTRRHPSRLVFCGLLAIALQGCSDLIVKDGQPRAVIIMDEGAAPLVSHAAKEIQTYVRKTSGAELPIRTGSKGNAQVEIRLRVEAPASGASASANARIVHPDGYRINSRGGSITITGGSPRGTLYGAYDFIERALGVRWFMPTPMGEDLEEKRTVRVPDLNLVKNPAFPSVSGFTWAGGPGSEEWELRMRVRVGVPVSFGHNWYNIHPLSEESFRKDPSMFALVGGERGRSSQLCSSNPRVVRMSAEAARTTLDAQPQTPLFSISPNDGTGFCECDQCLGIDALYGVTDGSLSDRFVHYANEVLADLETTHPGKQVGVYAYAEYTAPPRKARPRPNFVTALTHMPWEFCHVHAIEDPSCPSNRRFLEYLKGWLAVSKHVGVYEYYGHFFAFTPWPIVHSLRRDIPLFQRLGVDRFISETQQNWANQGINFYVAAKLVDDPSLDVDALLAEYFRRFYGKASVPMRQYFDLFEDTMQKTGDAGDGGYAWLSMFTPALVGQAGALLKDAEALASTDTEKVKTRIAFARLGFGFTDAFAKMLDAGLRKDVIGVLDWSAEAVKRVKATEGSAPQAFFVSLAVDQTHYLVVNSLARGVPPWVALRPRPSPTPATTP